MPLLTRSRMLSTTLLFLILVGCKKAGSAGTNLPPQNLQVTSQVSGDGSGLVSFSATAINVVSYQFDFGNGDTITVASGTVNHVYAAAGNNTYTVEVIAKSSSGQAIQKSITVTVMVKATDPVLVWSEEFDKDGAPDPASWSYDLGANGWGNHELENYTDRRQNSIVEGGLLKISALKEDYQGSQYTSARLVSKKKFEFTYGKVEIKAKLPAGVGTWPALWMLGANADTVSWPACGEIDIMEHVGKTQNTIYGTLHYPGRSGGNADGGTRKITDATQFHIYSLEWSPAAIKIYVDSQLVHSITNTAQLPFNHNFFLILNVAMGGDFGGPMDPSISKATMEVDYIRVYK